MEYRSALRLSFNRKTLAVVATFALAGPVAIGIVDARPRQAQSESTARPSFEVASVKPYKDDGVGPRNWHSTYSVQGIDFGGCSLGFIIAEAYHFPTGRIVGPRSLTKESLWGSLTRGYDIAAHANHAAPKEQLRLMLQSLLADRFKLMVHRETKPGPVYKLMVAKEGVKLEEAEAGGDFAASRGPDGFVFRNAEMERLAGYLSSYVDQLVVDETGLGGVYNFVLKMPEDLRANPPVKSEGGSPDSPSKGIFADSLKRLGLQLVAGTAPVEYLVVDRVERPSEN